MLTIASQRNRILLTSSEIQLRYLCSKPSFVNNEPILKGQCSCGKVGFVCKGLSTSNFITHSSAPRHASKKPWMAASGFKKSQVNWDNGSRILNSLENPSLQPPNSTNPHYFCPCDKKEYLGVDATRLLGVVAVNLDRVKEVPDYYKPNHHLFYADRVEDVNDNLPKWETVVQGKLIQSKETKVNTNGSQKPSKGAKTLPVAGKFSSTATSTWSDVTGQIKKDLYPISPIRAPESTLYHFTESDPGVNHVTKISPEKIQERVQNKYYASPGTYIAPKKQSFDAIIIGGGHNGLVSAAYLAKHGVSVCVLERRHVVGGAAVTEELYPGFKFSRASYLAGLLRPQIIEDLKLAKYGFKYLPRNPTSFTPASPFENSDKYLILGDDEKENWKSIAQFSEKDADAFPHYESFLDKVRELVDPILDGAPPQLFNPSDNWRSKRNLYTQLEKLVKVGWKNKEVLIPFYELFTAPATHILNRWFDSEILKTTLATDAVIGAMCSPTQAGSAYVLLHHVMGEAAGKKGVWAYVEGGMGMISQSIAESAKSFGAEIVTNATVKRILHENKEVVGVEMSDGTYLNSKIILSNATPYHTFLELLPGLSRLTGNTQEESPLPLSYQHCVRFADYSCGAFKINLAVDKLPNFKCFPSPADGSPGPMHRGTVHFETRMEEIETAYREASMGIPATRPVIEMTIPSSIDKTISPNGKHVVQLFVQYAPYSVDPKIGNWADESFKNQFADRICKIVDEYAPGFSKSILYRDVLSPLDLEKIFGLHKGNIFHGSLSLHQLGYARPVLGHSDYRTPLKGLYLCGSGAHPGGGVMGAAGKNAAFTVLGDLNRA